MMDMLSLTRYISQMIEANAEVLNMVAKVNDPKDGFLIDVDVLNKKNEIDTSIGTLQNILVFQSINFSPCIKKDDLGILLNIKIDINANLNEVTNNDIYEGDIFYIFIPLQRKKEFQSNAETFMIQSNSTKNNIKLDDKQLQVTIEEGDIIAQAKGAYTITTQDAFKLECKGYTMEATGTDPIVIKNSVGGLKEVIDNLFQCMDGLASGLTGTTSNPAAYNGVKPTAQQMINKIIG